MALHAARAIYRQIWIEKTSLLLLPNAEKPAKHLLTLRNLSIDKKNIPGFVRGTVTSTPQKDGLLRSPGIKTSAQEEQLRPVPTHQSGLRTRPCSPTRNAIAKLGCKGKRKCGRP